MEEKASTTGEGDLMATAAALAEYAVPGTDGMFIADLLRRARGLCSEMGDAEDAYRAVYIRLESLLDWIGHLKDEKVLKEEHEVLDLYGGVIRQFVDHMKTDKPATESKVTSSIEKFNVVIGKVVQFLNTKVELPQWYIADEDVEFDDGNRIASDRTCWGYRGKWEQSSVFVKLQPHASDGCSALVTFLEEAKIWAKLVPHPHILRCFGANHLAQKPFIVFEDCVSGNFNQYFANHGRERLWPLFYEAALGLKHLHDQGVVHGHLKCSKLLVGANGLARVCGLKPRSVLPNEVRWMAPELLDTDDVETSYASDVYGLGVCIVEAISGMPPFGIDNDDTVVEKLVGREGLERPDELADDTEWEFVRRLIVSDPNERITLPAAIKELKWLAGLAGEASKTEELALNNEGGEDMEKSEDLEEKTVAVQSDAAKNESPSLNESKSSTAPQGGVKDASRQCSCGHIVPLDEEFCGMCGLRVGAVKAPTDDVLTAPGGSATVDTANRPLHGAEAPTYRLKLRYDQRSRAANAATARLARQQAKAAEELKEVVISEPTQGVDGTSLKRCFLAYTSRVEGLIAKLAATGSESAASNQYNWSASVSLKERVYACVDDANEARQATSAEIQARAILQAPVTLTRLIRLRSELELLEASCEIRSYSWVQDWRADCADYAKSLEAIARGTTDLSLDETAATAAEARHIRSKYIAKLPKVEHKLMTQLFDENLPQLLETSEEPKAWFISSVECQRNKNDANSCQWNGSRVRLIACPESTEEKRAWCRQQAVEWAGLEHPSLVRLHGACDVGAPFLVCEYVEGESLASYANTTSPSPKMLWLKLYETAIGLLWLHQRGIVCGDITGDNIVVCSTGRVKLDFHSSGAAGAGSKAGGDVKPQRRAPEIMSGESESSASDVFSFGTTIEKAVAEYVISDSAAALVEAMTAKDPGDRPSMAGVVSAMYDQIIEADRSLVSDAGTSLAKVIQPASSALAQMKEISSPGLNIFLRIVVRINNAAATEDPDVPASVASIAEAASVLVQKYADSPRLAQLALTHQVIQKVKSLHEQLDDEQHTPARVSSDLQPLRLWEQPFEISCSDLVKQWKGRLVAEVTAAAAMLDADRTYVEVLTLLKYEWTTYWAVMSTEVKDLFLSAYTAVADAAKACVLSVPSWFTPSYDLHKTNWEGESVLVKQQSNADSEATVVTQAALWSRLHHRNVVRFIGACHVGRECFLAFDCDPDTPPLVEYIRSKQLNRREVWRLLQDAAEGLAYLHQQQIAHGALTSDAIRVCSEVSLAGQDSRGASKFEATEIHRPPSKRSLSKLVGDTLHVVLLLKPAPNGQEQQSNAQDDSFIKDIKALCRCIVECVTGVQLAPEDEAIGADDEQRWSEIRQRLGDQAWQMVDRMRRRPAVDMAYVVGTLGRFAINDPLETAHNGSKHRRDSSMSMGGRSGAADSNGDDAGATQQPNPEPALDQLRGLRSRHEINELASQLVDRLENLLERIENSPGDHVATKSRTDAIIVSSLAVLTGNTAGPALRTTMALVSIHRQLDKLMDAAGWSTQRMEKLHNWASALRPA